MCNSVRPSRWFWLLTQQRTCSPGWRPQCVPQRLGFVRSQSPWLQRGNIDCWVSQYTVALYLWEHHFQPQYMHLNLCLVKCLLLINPFTWSPRQQPIFEESGTKTQKSFKTIQTIEIQPPCQHTLQADKKNVKLKLFQWLQLNKINLEGKIKLFLPTGVFIRGEKANAFLKLCKANRASQKSMSNGRYLGD